MNDLNKLIADNLKKIREEKRLSLDKLSQLTGISKSMLGQIENGKSNPTITTLSKIAYGLNIQVTNLITTPEANTIIMDKNNVKALEEDNGRYKLYPFFPISDGRCFEIYFLEMDLDACLNSDAHIDGTEEFLTVFQGEVTIIIENEKYIINEGSSIRFKADRPHIYCNSGNTVVKSHLIVYRHP